MKNVHDDFINCLLRDRAYPVQILLTLDAISKMNNILLETAGDIHIINHIISLYRCDMPVISYLSGDTVHPIALCR